MTTVDGDAGEAGVKRGQGVVAQRQRLKEAAPDLSSRSRLRVFWQGRVQGVGFRYTAETAALGLKLVGWVRNLPDGRVEALCEGARSRLQQFLEEVRTGPMARHIRDVQVQWEAPSGEFREFEIRFS